jgi:hypothetical protein
VDVIIGAAVADGKVTPKVQSLIKILLKYQDTQDFRAIIFVERVVSALVLPKVEMLIDGFVFVFINSVFQVPQEYIVIFCQACRSLQSFLL